MNAFKTTLWLLIVCATSGLAGEIYGTIRADVNLVGAGVRLEAKSASRSYQATTDQFGTYRLYVAETGRCTLTVQYQGQSLSLDVQSYDTSVRFDLVLERQDGIYTLKRQ